MTRDPYRRLADRKLNWIWRRILRSQRSRWPASLELVTIAPFDPRYDLR